jgi:predicted secreted protein
MAMKIPTALLVTCLLLPALPGLCAQARAHEPREDMSRSRVQLEARASAEVQNDTMRAVLFAEMEDPDPAKLAERLNRVAGEALRVLKSTSALRVRSGGYSTYPVSEQGKILRWRSRSEVIVESEDFDQVSAAIARVQGGLQLAEIEFSVSPAKRAETERALTETAIKQFLARARLVTESFDGANYHVADATVVSDSAAPPAPMPMMMRKSVSTAEAVPPPLEAGTSRITVTVTGAILIPR